MRTHRCSKRQGNATCRRNALPGKDFCEEHYRGTRAAQTEAKMRYDITSARHKAKMEKLLGQDPLDLSEELALLRLLIDEDQKVAFNDDNLNAAEKEAAKDKLESRLKTHAQAAKTFQQIQKNSNQLIDRQVLMAALSRFLLVVKAATDHLPDKGQIMANIGEGVMEIARELRNTETITVEAHNNGRITQQTLEQQDDSP